jgi:two-component system sensor histidine kinase PilS (NtrC family)
MHTQPDASTWFGPSLFENGYELGDKPGEFERLWRGFMTARATLGLVLVLLQGGIYFFNAPHEKASLLICVAYFVTAMTVRLVTRPQQLGNSLDVQWLRTVGVDVLVFTALQTIQSNSINYTPLLALPVLMASILGSMRMAMATSAGVTLLLFAYAAWTSTQSSGDISSHFLQVALTGAGCFAISFIASQLATRLANMELRAQRSQLAVAAQQQVNALVIESMSDGILVVDERHLVRAANPAANMLLGTKPGSSVVLVNLQDQAGWQDLLNLVMQSFAEQCAKQDDIIVRHPGQGPRRLHVRTQLTAPLAQDAQSLCVVFIQDQREMQARMRTEKLASMGRMSAAVAHEIRNPLAAIVQANALLAEDLSDPTQKRLTSMVQKNAQRLEKIVQNVLHLTHAPTHDAKQEGQATELTETVRRICRDWQNQNTAAPLLGVDLSPGAHLAWFDPEHLRRIVVNLLDNALRYASHEVAAIQVGVDFSRENAAPFEPRLWVWSNGDPMEASVEQHLFEPFFSSESRSSGLGLYICRELCDSHGATITYDRTTRLMNKQPTEGNEFTITFKTPSSKTSTNRSESRHV